MRRFVLTFALVPGLHLLPASAYAQIATGAVSGLISDSTGAAVVNARIDLQSDSTGTQQHLDTDRLGEFLFNDLPPDSYSLQVHASGFDTLRVAHVTVELGRTARLAPSLRIAARAETVEVQGVLERPDFDSPVNENLSPQDLGALPLDGRRFQTLATLTPLASAEPSDTTDDQPSDTGSSTAPADTDNVRVAFRGLPPLHNSYSLDGANLTRAFDGEPRGGRALPFTVAQEAVREFQVHAVGAGSVLGRDAGGSINTVTHRGELHPHGTLFFLVRNSAMGAANPFAAVTRYNNGAPTTTLVKPRDQREQFGGSAGGRLLPHAALFGIVSAEGQRRSFPAVSTPSLPGFYTLSATQSTLLANRGVNSAATARALSFLDSLTGPVDRQANEFSLLPRLDWQPGTRSILTAEWARVRFHSPGGRRYGPVEAVDRSGFGNVDVHTDTVLLRGTVAIADRWTNTLRLQWSRDAAFSETPAPLPGEPLTGPGNTSPTVSIAGSFRFGSQAAIGTRRLPEEHRYEFGEELSFSGRAHALVLGATVSGIDDRIGLRDNVAGAYDYTSSMTGGHAGGLVDFITDFTYNAAAYPNGGCPSIYAQPHYFCFESFTQTFGTQAETRFHTAEVTVFADDSWRPTPNVRIGAGIRYEWNRLPPPQHSNAALDAALAAALGNGIASTSTMPSDTNNLAPHLGIAWAPSTGTVVRASYGYHFGRVTGRTLEDVLSNTAQPASQAQVRITPRTLLSSTCTSYGTNFGYPGTYTCSPFGAQASISSATVFSSGFQMPALQTGEVSVTQSLGSHTTLSGSYIFGLARQLTNSVDLNIAPSASRVAFSILRNGGEPGARGGEVWNVPLYSARRIAAYGTITGILSDGTGTYNALVLQVERHATRTITGHFTWTYSKALDTVRSTNAAPDENGRFDPFQTLYDRAPSNFDHRHRATFAAVWQPDSRRVIAAGWTVAPIITYASGRPYSYRITGGTALPGGRESLNGSGGAIYLPTVGRNTLRLPSTANIDLRITRLLFHRDRLATTLTAEAFNLINHVNVTEVEQRAFIAGDAGEDGIIPLTFQDSAAIAAEGVSYQPFGTPTSSADSPARERRLQFGLRMRW